MPSVDSFGCEGPRSPTTEDELSTSAKKIALDQFRQDAAPCYETPQTTLMDSTDGAGPSDAKDKLKKGWSLSRGDLETILSLYKDE